MVGDLHLVTYECQTCQTLSVVDGTAHEGSEADKVWQVWHSKVSRCRSPTILVGYTGIPQNTTKIILFHQKSPKTTKMMQKHDFKICYGYLFFLERGRALRPRFSVGGDHLRTENILGVSGLRPRKKKCPQQNKKTGGYRTYLL